MYIAKDGTEIRKHSIQNKVNNSVQNLNNKNIQNKEKSSPVNRDITGQFILETSASNELCQPVLGSSKESSYFIENELGQSNLEILQSNISFAKNKLNKSFQMCEEGTSFTAKEELDQSLQENTKENDYYAKNVSNRSVVKNEKEIVYMTKSKIQTFPKNKRNYSRAKVDNDDCCASPVKKIGAVSTEIKQHHSVSKEESSVMYNADKNTIKTNIEKKKEYQFHMQPQHTVNGKQGKKQYRCDICAGIYRHAFSLKRHFLRNHINYKYLSDSDIANCSINVNSLKDVYEAPSKEHTGKRIGTPEAIIENEITQVSTSEDMIGLYRCHLCQQLFNVRDDLKTHVTNHPAVSSQKNFSCPDCDMTFTHKQNLVRHSSVHSETKTFKYSLCFKKFRTAEKLQKHETLHKGGKTVVCNYCNGFFALEKSLKKHIMKFHKEHVFPCSQCSRNFLTKVLLEKHERLKHSVKLLDSYNVDQTEGCGEIANNNGTESEGKIVNLTVGDCQTGIQVSCSVCKKQFTSYVNMCRHWRLAHHYVPRGKQGKYKSGRSVFVCHSSDLQNDKKAGGEISEAEFFMTVAEKISENLINFVDGKSSQILNGAKKPTAECKMTIRPKVQWTNYNFPSDFDFSQMKEVSYETEWSKPRSTEPEVLLDESNILKAIGLKQEYGDCEEGSESSYVHNLSEESELLSDEEILMNKSNIPKTETTEPLGKDCIEERTIKYICNTCGERFGSLEVIEDHKLNNHLNVFCTHIEIEGEKEIPPEICYNFCSSVGVLKSSIVPPLTCTENSKLHCTKCQRLFSSVSDLHLHILECGGDKAFINFKPDMKKKYRNKMLRWKKIGKGIQRYLDRFEHASNHHKKHKKIENLKSPMWELRYPKYSSQHTRIGKDDKAEIFSCDGCETKFYYLAAFQRHRRGCPLKIAMEGNSSTAPHTDNKTLSQRHSCLHCGKRFTYLARLKKHMKNNCYRTKEQESVFSVNSTDNTATTENNANKKDASTLGTLPLKCDQVSLEGNVTDVGCERNKKTVELKLEKTCFKIDEEHRDVGLVLLENDSQPEECSVPVVVEKDISETSLIASSPSSLDSISVLPTYNTRKSLRKCRKVYVPEQVKINSRRNKTKKELELSDINLDKPCNSSYLAFPQKSEMSNLSKKLKSI
ncbi:uncharacterized protein LOC143254349 [Tachypleus tridentatus]|uniref:uncharacterized protein LOC143254349 n=1 Tax=Tachypleus tridentatus TaxID=6853 RepID=UPI003FCFD50B